MAVQIPDASARLAMEDGRPSRVWYPILSRLAGLLNRASASLDTKAAVSQAWQEAVLIEFADDKDYRFVDWAFAWTITEVVARSASGTCTVTVKINATALGGDPNSVTTTESSEAHETANAVAAGDDIVITVSDNSSAEDVSVTLKGTRTLD